MLKLDGKIYDAVHGFIRFNALEQELIDSEPFQRLHQVHQLGISFLVYPGATHTRFEHSLGTMELATRIFDRISAKTEVPEEVYWRQILRLAALCHDLGHLPFSHDAEDVLLGKGGHEQWTLQVIKSTHCAPVWQKMAELFPGHDVEGDVIKMAIGQEKLEGLPFSPWEKVLSQVITGDFFGADRIDYLLRDAQCTGVSYGLFDYQQLIEMLCILPEGESKVLGVEENGIASCEALLLARHFMHQRVYQYSSVVGYKFHLGRFMRQYYLAGGFLDSLEGYLSQSDSEILSALRLAAQQEQPDAAALLKKRLKFRAVEIKEGLLEEELERVKRELSIPSHQICWQFAQEPKQELGLSFPVLTRQNKITPAATLSEIRIPTTSLSWLFIAPEYKQVFP